MKTLFLICGPILVVLLAFLLWGGYLNFGKAPGIEHQAGVEEGGTMIMVNPPTTAFPATSDEETSDVNTNDLLIDIEPATVRPAEF